MYHKGRALVKYSTICGDEVLQSHLESCSNQETWLPKTSQKQLLQFMGDFIHDCIVAEVKERHTFLSLPMKLLTFLVGSNYCSLLAIEKLV